MGYFSNIELEIQEMAHDMGDDFGQDAETILTIARIMQLRPEEVQRVLNQDFDTDPIPEDPSFYMEEQADEDAIYYGRS